MISHVAMDKRKGLLIFIFFLLAALLFSRILRPSHTVHIPATAPLSPFASPSLTHAPVTANVFLLNAKTLATRKSQLRSGDIHLQEQYLILLKDANALLHKKPPSVMDKTQTSPNGDKHDYYSLAPYYWPNPLSKKLPYINRDGEVNPERNAIPDSRNLANMIAWSHTLALAYYFSDNEEYATQSAALLKTWFINPATKMNPNLNYAQIIKNKKGALTVGTIDAATLPLVVDTIALLDSSTALTSTDKTAMKQWFTEYLYWLRTSKKAQYAKQLHNNIGTWYDLQIVTIALFIGDQKTAYDTLTGVEQQRIPEQIKPDGEQPLETKRTKSWDYSIYNLEALTDLATVSTHTSVNLWKYQTSDGRSIKKAIDFLLPYIAHEETWPYKQIEKATAKNLIVPLRQASDTYGNKDYLRKSKDIEETYRMNNYFDLLYLY
jgi:hypothetical protein